MVESGLKATVYIHNVIDAALESSDGSGTVVIGKKEAVKLRKLIAKCNRVLSVTTRMSHEREDRMALELGILKISTKQEHILRDANRARTYDCLRVAVENQNTRLMTAAAASGTPNLQIQNEVDKTLASVSRVESALEKLAPVTPQDTHGAGLIAALDRGQLDEVLDPEERLTLGLQR